MDFVDHVNQVAFLQVVSIPFSTCFQKLSLEPLKLYINSACNQVWTITLVLPGVVEILVEKENIRFLCGD